MIALQPTEPGRWAALQRCYGQLLQLCDQLEDIADRLPGRVTAAETKALAKAILAGLADTHAEEELALLPALAMSPKPELRRLAQRLRQEYDADTQSALELAEVLVSLNGRQPLLSPDATGYLLRAFFESVRRHVRSEQDLLILLDAIPPASGAPN